MNTHRYGMFTVETFYLKSLNLPVGRSVYCLFPLQPAAWRQSPTRRVTQRALWVTWRALKEDTSLAVGRLVKPCFRRGNFVYFRLALVTVGFPLRVHSHCYVRLAKGYKLALGELDMDYESETLICR